MIKMRQPYPNELMHYGVLGMKWGVRRYQNADGTLTAAGRAHYGVKGDLTKSAVGRTRNSMIDAPLNNKKSVGKKIARNVGVAAGGIAAAGAIAGAKKAVKNNPGLFEATIKGGKDKPNISPAEQAAKSSEKTLDAAQDILRTAQRMKNRTEESQSKTMSDEDLRRAINRMELERRYDSLSSSDVSSGLTVAMDVIEMTKDVAVAAGAVAAAYKAIKKIKG